MAYNEKALSKAGYDVVGMPRLDPGANDLRNAILPGLREGSVSGLDYLSKIAGGGDEGFAPYENVARREYERAQGNLASRFSGMGIGSLDSSAFQNASGALSMELGENLSARRQQMQMSAIQQLLGMSSDIFHFPSEEYGTVNKKKKRSFWDNVMGIGLPAAGATLGGIFGGPAGAYAGGSIGGFAAQPFLS